jgi:hypothetical protein
MRLEIFEIINDKINNIVIVIDAEVDFGVLNEIIEFNNRTK